MATQPLDASGEAGPALSTVVQDHGAAALSNPQLMNSLLQDLMPGSPRESRVLVAAADADVAGILQERARQHIGTAAAVLQAAAALEERTALTPDACQWAARKMAEALGLPSEAKPEPGPEPVPRPEPAPRPQPDRHSWPSPVPSPTPTSIQQRVRMPASAAIAAAWAALACALSIPLQLLASVPFNSGYSWLLALNGLVLFGAAALTFGSKSKSVGTGMIFGAALSTVPNFVETSFLHGIGGWFVAASVLTTLTALVAAGISITYLARNVHLSLGNLRRPLVAAFCVAAAGLALAKIPGPVQSGSGADWTTETGLLGHGVHGWFIFAGLVALVASVVPAVIAASLTLGTSARAGAVTGWLLVSGAVLVFPSVVATFPQDRPGIALYFEWILLVAALVLGVGMLASDRTRRASGVQAPAV